MFIFFLEYNTCKTWLYLSFILNKYYQKLTLYSSKSSLICYTLNIKLVEFSNHNSHTAEIRVEIKCIFKHKCTSLYCQKTIKKCKLILVPYSLKLLYSFIFQIWYNLSKNLNILLYYVFMLTGSLSIQNR